MTQTAPATSDRPAAAAPPCAPAQAVEIKTLDPAKLRFYRAGATLRLEVADTCTWLQVRVLRAFPLSCPAAHLSVRDGGGNEIGVLPSTAGLDPAGRAEVEAELERRYRVTIIRRVLDVTERFGTVDWEVETNRGPCRFTTRDLREGVLRFGDSHYLLTDVENNRFEVPDLNALDRRSQATLLRHL
jgi:hypothetical protein